MPSATGKPQYVPVWDPVVRVFHWTLVAAFFTAFLAEPNDLLALHVSAGYLVLTLVAGRIVWGYVGSAHARFNDFVTAPRATAAYIADMLAGKAKRYLGHNPAGGAMIVLMLIALTATAVSGLAVYGADQHLGPLSGLLGGVSEGSEHLLEEVHEVSANLTLALIGIHVLGVVIGSWLHRENLVRAMITGRKRA